MTTNTTDKSEKSMSLIVTKGTLDWAYPPFILATTAAAMDVKVSMFFTFYGLQLLKKELDLHVSAVGKPDMAMPMAGHHITMPNMLAMLPGMNSAATAMMKNLIDQKNVPTIRELRDTAIESGVELIGCQMTLDLFEYKTADLIPETQVAGAATYIERALSADINLFI